MQSFPTSSSSSRLTTLPLTTSREKNGSSSDDHYSSDFTFESESTPVGATASSPSNKRSHFSSFFDQGRGYYQSRGDSQAEEQEQVTIEVTSTESSDEGLGPVTGVHKALPRVPTSDPPLFRSGYHHFLDPRFAFGFVPTTTTTATAAATAAASSGRESLVSSSSRLGPPNLENDYFSHTSFTPESSAPSSPLSSTVASSPLGHNQYQYQHQHQHQFHLPPYGGAHFRNIHAMEGLVVNEGTSKEAMASLNLGSKGSEVEADEMDYSLELDEERRKDLEDPFLFKEFSEFIKRYQLGEWGKEEPLEEGEEGGHGWGGRPRPMPKMPMVIKRERERRAKEEIKQFPSSVKGKERERSGADSTIHTMEETPLEESPLSPSSAMLRALSTSSQLAATDSERVCSVSTTTPDDPTPLSSSTSPLSFVTPLETSSLPGSYPAHELLSFYLHHGYLPAPPYRDPGMASRRHECIEMHGLTKEALAQRSPTGRNRNGCKDQLDRLVKTIQKVFEVKAAIVNILSIDEIFVASSTGWEAGEPAKGERPEAFYTCDLPNALCTHNHLRHPEERTMVVDDCTKDWRLQDNPFVINGGPIQSYAGATILLPYSPRSPLPSPSSQHSTSPQRSSQQDWIPIGTLCLADDHPHAPGSFTERDRRMLVAFADQAANAIRLEYELSQKIKDARTSLDWPKERIRNEARQHIHGIRTQLDLIRVANHGQQPPQSMEPMVLGAEVCSELLDQLFEDVLDSQGSRLEDPQFDPVGAKVDLRSLATEVSQNMWARKCKMDAITGKMIGQIDFVVEVEDRLGGWDFMVDRERLKRILVNTLSNAFKFTTSGSVKLQLYEVFETEHHEDEHIIAFVVEDTGCGIDKNFLDNSLFVPFQQQDGFMPGAGLGMSICEAVIRRLGGKIDVASTPGIGTRVNIKLPLLSASTTESTSQPLTTTSPSHVRTMHRRLMSAESFPYHHLSAATTPTILPPPHQPPRFFRPSLPRLGTAPTVLPSSLPVTRVSSPVGFLGRGNHHHHHHPHSPSNLLSTAANILTSKLTPNFLKRDQVPIATTTTPSVPSTTRTTTIRAGRGTGTTGSSSPEMDREKRKASSSPESTDKRSAKKRSRRVFSVLVADDNPIARKSVERLLERMNIRFRAVDNGAKAVLAFREFNPPPRLILMDIQMPVMDGLEATRKIREVEKENGLEPSIIFALTGLSTPLDMQAGQLAGVDEWLVKGGGLKGIEELLRKYQRELEEVDNGNGNNIKR